MAMTPKEMLEYQAAQRRGRTGSADVPTGPLRRNPAQVTPRTTAPTAQQMRGVAYRKPSQAEMMLQYENLGEELTNPNRTAESVQTATAQRAALLRGLRRDGQGQVAVPHNVRRTAAGFDYSDANINKRVAPVAPERQGIESPVAGVDRMRPHQVQGADGNFYRMSEDELHGITAEMGDRAVMNAPAAAESPIRPRGNRSALQYLGDMAADKLTGGRVSARKDAEYNAAMGTSPGTADSPDAEAARLALGDRLNTGLPSASGTYVGPGGSATAPGIENANGLRAGPAGGGGPVYRNPDGSYTNVKGLNQKVVELGDSVISSNGIGTPELRSLADVIRNRWANNIAAGGRRMGGGAAGGANILRQINQIHRQADKTFEQVRNATNNSKAAERAANSIRSRADSLLGYQQNVAYADRNEVDRQAIASDDAYRHQLLGQKAAQMSADMQAKAQETKSEWVENLAMVNTPDGPEMDYDGLAFAADVLGVNPDSRTAMTGNATALRGLMQFRRDYATKSGRLPDRAEMERVMTLAAEASNLDLADAFKSGDVSFLDVFLSNIGFGPSALRIGDDTAVTYDRRNFTRGSQDRFRGRDRDRNR